MSSQGLVRLIEVNQENSSSCSSSYYRRGRDSEVSKDFDDYNRGYLIVHNYSYPSSDSRSSSDIERRSSRRPRNNRMEESKIDQNKEKEDNRCLHSIMECCVNIYEFIKEFCFLGFIVLALFIFLCFLMWRNDNPVIQAQNDQVLNRVNIIRNNFGQHNITKDDSLEIDLRNFSINENQSDLSTQIIQNFKENNASLSEIKSFIFSRSQNSNNIDHVKLLDICIPSKMQKFTIDGSSKMRIEPLWNYISKVSHTFNIYNIMGICKSQFEHTVKSSSHLHTLSFKGCSIDNYNSYNFQTQNAYKIKVLSFSNQSLSFLEAIIRAIADSGLRNSLETLVFDQNNCGNSLDYVLNQGRSYMDSLGMKNIEITKYMPS